MVQRQNPVVQTDGQRADPSSAHRYGPGSFVSTVRSGPVPGCYVIKADAEAMVYHRPDSSAFVTVTAGVWFDSPSAAEDAGFAAAESHPADGDATAFEPGGGAHPWSALAVAAYRSGVVGAQPAPTAGMVELVGGRLKQPNDAASGPEPLVEDVGTEVAEAVTVESVGRRSGRIRTAFSRLRRTN